MKKLRLLIILVILITFSCQKEAASVYEDVTLKNLNNFDGCGYVFANKDGKYLEPRNLSDFLTTYNDGDKFQLKYKLADQQASICMVGNVITILELKSQNK